jgi:hypothetical protein
LLSLNDTGIFYANRFFGTNDKTEGTGTGLSVAPAIVAKRGGGIANMINPHPTGCLLKGQFDSGNRCDQESQSGQRRPSCDRFRFRFTVPGFPLQFWPLIRFGVHKASGFIRYGE